MKIIIFIAMLLSAAIVYGQPDFTGKWKLNADKSDFGLVEHSVAPTRLVVEQKAGTITYQRNDRAKETLKINSEDGFEIKEATMTTKVTMKTTPDNKGLVETRNYIYPEGQTGDQVRKTRTWTLSDDKRTLIIDDHIESINGLEYDMQLVYERE